MNESIVDERIRAWAAERRLPQTQLVRWLGLADEDRLAMLKLAEQLRMRAGQFLAAYELLDEISVRESASITSILSRTELCRVIEGDGSAPGRARGLLDVLRAIRFPRLKRMTERLVEKVAELKLPPNIRVVLPADLQSDELRLELIAHDSVELHQSLEKLFERRAELCRLADILGGSDAV